MQTKAELKLAIVGAIVGLIVAVWSVPASAQDANAQRELSSLRESVAKIRRLNDDPSARFSASQTIADLQALAATAQARPDAKAELRQIYILIGTIEHKRKNLMKAREMLSAGLAIESGHAPDAGQDSKDHYRLAEMASELSDYSTAATHYGKAAELAKSATGLTQNQRLGMREKYAYALHEAGRLKEAYEVNRALLADGTEHFGTDGYELRTVLTNIAQNLHALGRGAEAEPYLKRNLTIVRRNADIEREQDMLFQLGVLTYELKRPAEARAYMTERIALLEKHGDAGLLATARDDLAELERKLR
jgi:tetratricopeptide (TPR) repeat protein